MGHFYAVEIEVQIGIHIALKKCVPECPVEVRGGGCNRYLGNAQIRPNNLEVFPYAQSEQMVAEAALNTRGGADGNTQEVASNQR